MNIYVFLLTSMALFLVQLFAYLILFWLISMLIGWPIKRMALSIKRIIRRAGT